MTRERPVQFGPGECLRGIVSDGEANTTAERPACLMVNAGLVHHVGPARLHVTLARELAARGTTCLRFDLSGMGDSEGRCDRATGQSAAIQDVRDAMDLLSATRGVHEFIVFGICAGAHIAFESTKADPRIVGLVSIDGYAYRTPRYYWEYYRSRMFRLAPWAHFVREQGRRLAALVTSAQRRDGDVPQGSTFRVSFPPRQQVALDLDALGARGVQQFYIFTAAHGRLYDYDRQFYDAFPFLEASRRVRVTHWPWTGHMFEGLDAQTTLVREVVAWVDGVQPAGAGARSADTGAAVDTEFVL